jgi:hypothetical protein
MSGSGHGGSRVGAGRKPSTERKVKRSVTLSVAIDAAVLAAMQPDESYSQALERLVQTVVAARDGDVTKLSTVEVLVAALGPEREAVASVYRRLGWSRQEFEGIVQTHGCCWHRRAGACMWRRKWRLRVVESCTSPWMACATVP